MRLYEINAQLEELLANVDPETGELMIDTDALEALQIAKTEKLEGIALYIKDLKALATEIAKEAVTLSQRKKTLDGRIERLTALLADNMDGKLETARVRVSTRKNAPSADIEDMDNLMIWLADQRNDLLRFSEPTLNRTALTKALKDGEEIPFCKLKQTTSLVIK